MQNLKLEEMKNQAILPEFAPKDSRDQHQKVSTSVPKIVTDLSKFITYNSKLFFPSHNFFLKATEKQTVFLEGAQRN